MVGDLGRDWLPPQGASSVPVRCCVAAVRVSQGYDTILGCIAVYHQVRLQVPILCNSILKNNLTLVTLVSWSGKKEEK